MGVNGMHGGYTRWLLVLALACLCRAAAGAAAAAGAPAATPGMQTAYIRLNAVSHDQFAKTIRLACDHGAVLRHRIYPSAAMGLIPAESRYYIAALEGVLQVFVGPIPEQAVTELPDHERNLARAYNAVYFPKSRLSDGAFTDEQISLAEAGTAIDPGPLEIPEEYLKELSGAAGDARAVATVRPPTSEFMLGHVAVGVIMPESDGVGTHDWTDSEEAAVVEEVLSAMNYWAEYAPGNELYFSYEINYRVPIRIEPLDRGGWAIEDKWAAMSLSQLGFEGVNYFGQAYSYVDALREGFDSDWGFLIFILHGFENQSLGSMLAYSYLGGPFNVNVSSNGSLGTENLDRVIAHETGHTFYTLDEYQSSPHDCSVRSGYLDVENANKVSGGSACKLSIPCIMRGADASMGIEDLPPCLYTRGQVGWWDGDGDGIPDVLDTEPTIESLALDLAESGAVMQGDTLYSTVAVLKGTAASVPFTNMNAFSEVNPRDVTIEPVEAQYRVDGGEWALCDPEDGRFDDPREGFAVVTRELAPWSWHTVEVRGVTAHGNVTPDSLAASIQFFAVPSQGRRAVVRLASSNPTRPPVAISFVPSHPSGRAGVSVPVTLAIYDAMGRMVAIVERGEFETGKIYRASWDGRDSAGRPVPAGVYFIGMRNPGDVAADKVLVIP
jgi:hypothetical protein